MTDYLLNMAQSLTYNQLSNNYLYIFSEITNDPTLQTEPARFEWLLRQQPIPCPLADIMPEVLAQYTNLHDINLYIHQAKRYTTVIAIRFYPRSALTVDYQQAIAYQPPMLHTKLPIPYWVDSPSLKFDVNWKVHAPVTSLKRWTLTQKWRLMTYLERFQS